jgi:hypothetical protein
LVTLGKTIYLPSVYDPKKIREGILEIISLVQAQELKEANEAKLCEKVG